MKNRPEVKRIIDDAIAAEVVKDIGSMDLSDQNPKAIVQMKRTFSRNMMKYSQHCEYAYVDTHYLMNFEFHKFNDKMDFACMYEAGRIITQLGGLSICRTQIKAAGHALFKQAQLQTKAKVAVKELLLY
jgi:hypothetical protein